MTRLALAVLAALALATSGCGGAASEPNLAEAAEKTEASGSFAFEVAVRTFDGEIFSGRCEGVVDSERERARVSCGPDSRSSFAGFESIEVDGAGYYRTRGEQKWAKEPAVEDGSLNEFTPSQVLELLRSASLETERVGEEDVRGEPTVRYTLTVDCTKAELTECAGEEAEVAVWVGEDGLVRRIRLDRPEVGFDLEFFDFGLPAEIEPPPADDVVGEAADTGDQPAVTEPVQECAEEAARPIRVAEALRVLRAHGFRIRGEKGGCSPGMAGFVVGRVPEGDGELWCMVYVEGAVAGGSVGSNDGSTSVTRRLENLTCHLIVAPGESGEPAERLDAAFADLKRELRE
jgi:hypothetical protein